MATTVKANLKAGGLPVQEEQQMEALVGAETLGRLHEKDKIQSRASASSSTTTTTTTIPSLLNDTSDWPCPDLEPCDYHRRPSWQEEEHYLNNRGGGGSSSETTATHSHTTRIHNPFSLSLRTLPPRSVSPGAGAGVSSAIHHQSTAATTTTTTTASSYKKNSNSNSNLKIPQPSHNNKITFLSPFDQHHNNQYAAFLPVPAVEAPLSPFCLPGSPFTDLDMESLASSPGLGTPSSMASGSGSTTGSCYCNGNAAGLGPFDGAAPSSYRQLAPRQPSLQPSDLSPSSSSSHDPSSSSSSATAYLSTSPTSSSKPYYGFRSPSQGNTALDHCMQQSDNNLQYRRRSVDVGTLGNARGHQRHGRTSQADAPAAAFVPPDQLKAHRTRKTNSLRSKEFLFAQHLTSILRHSLSLCSIVAPDADIEAWSNAATPRSSISSMSSNGLPSISDRLEAPVPLHVASSSSSNTTPRRLRLPSLPHIVPQRRAELINMLSSWSFDANLLDLDELCECACIIFECFLESEGLTKETAGTPAKWRTFMISIRAAYHPQNAYHNFAHAVDVLQACYSFVVHLGVAPPLSRLQEQQQMDGQSRQSKWRRDEKLNLTGRIGDILRPLDVLALLVAAIGHDVGHPGLTNAYMINARTPAAQVYNDKSVLENFHSVTLIRMLKIHGFGHLLEESEQGLGTDFRQVLLTSVLVTDMSRHFPFVEKLTQMGERMKINGYRSTEVKEDRLVICSALMKCGDISNPSRPHNVASFWSSALLEEWAVQAEIEAKFELPISVMQLKSDNSNRSDERMAQAKSQVGFINLFTQPLFDKLAAAVPSFQLFADYCAAGRKPWEAIISKLEEQKTETKDEISATLPEASEESKSALSRALSTPPSVSIPEIRISQYKPAPHRLPWSAKTSEFPFDASTPLSPTTVSTFGTSPSTTSSYFKDGRSSPTSSATTFSSSSWIPSNVVEAYHPLAEEACTDNCSSITALCATCARRQRQQWDDADSASASQLTGTCATLVTSGQWPPEPFRPSPATKA